VVSGVYGGYVFLREFSRNDEIIQALIDHDFRACRRASKQASKQGLGDIHFYNTTASHLESTNLSSEAWSTGVREPEALASCE